VTVLKVQDWLDALTHYRSLSPQPVTDLARSLTFDAAQLKRFLEGIALAEEPIRRSY
jgi:hypothetical protein